MVSGLCVYPYTLLFVKQHSEKVAGEHVDDDDNESFVFSTKVYFFFLLRTK